LPRLLQAKPATAYVTPDDDPQIWTSSAHTAHDGDDEGTDDISELQEQGFIPTQVLSSKVERMELSTNKGVLKGGVDR